MPYKFNGKEKDEETGLYYYGARYYDPMIAFWNGVDLKWKDAPNMSAYNYCFNNPVKLIDPDGKWPFSGVGFRFFKGNAGVGVNYALSASQQSGVAYDKYGTTHFVASRINHITNQNLYEGSKDPNVLIGAEASLSAGIEYNWDAKSFLHTISGSTSTSISVGGKAIVGGEIGFSDKSASLSAGIGVGASMSVGSMSIDFSVSLTKSEAKKVGKLTDVAFESWQVRDQKAEYGKNGKITGFSGTVYTSNKKGDKINTGIKVQSGYKIIKKGVADSDRIWSSSEYRSLIKNNYEIFI